MRHCKYIAAKYTLYSNGVICTSEKQTLDTSIFSLKLCTCAELGMRLIEGLCVFRFLFFI